MSLFSNKKQAFGLEISDASIKVIQLKKSGLFYHLQSFRSEPIPAGLVIEGEIKNQYAVAQYLQKIIQTTEPKRISTPYVVCGLPENKTFVRVITIPKMTPEELSEGIKWEAEQYIPLPINSVYLDWQIISEEENKLKILVAAAPITFVDSYIETLKKAKLELQVLDLEEAAESRALISKKDESKTSLIIDLGATKTVFIIQDHGIVPFASNTLEISGQKFTEAIAQMLKIKPEEAENKKLTPISANLTSEENQILQAIQPLFNKLSQEINKILAYYLDHYENANPINQITLCGGGSAISGLIPFLTLNFKQKISIGNPLANLPLRKITPNLQNSLLSATTVIGLGIRGADLLTYQRK